MTTITHEEIKEIAREISREEGKSIITAVLEKTQPRIGWMQKALPIIISVLALTTGSLGLGAIKGVFVLNRTVDIVERLDKRVEFLEREGTPKLNLHVVEDDARYKNEQERLNKLESLILQNATDHTRILERLAVIESLQRQSLNGKPVAP